MSFSSQTPIRGTARGHAEAIYEWARAQGCKRPSHVRHYLETVYELAPRLNLNPDVMVAQSVLETSEGGAPWASRWWQERCNPAGIGITGSKLQNEASRDFKNGEAAARAHLLHLSLYVHGDAVPDGFETSEDPRWNAAIEAGYAGIATTLDDLTDRWAKDNRYAEKIAERLGSMEEAGLLGTAPSSSRPETPSSHGHSLPKRPAVPSGYTRYDWPGLENPVYLPDWIKVEIRLIPKKQGWTSGIPSKAHVKTTWHDTGNPNSNADGEWDFANNGRPGAAAASYNGVFDDRKVIITQRFDELVGHARNDQACRTSYAFEQAWGGKINFAKSVEVGCAVHGAVCAAKGWEVDTALVQHNHWPQGPKGEHKNCPGQIRGKNIWSTVVKQASIAAATARAAAGGGGQPVDPFPSPIPVPVLDEISSSAGLAPFRVHDPATDITYIWLGDRARAIQSTGRYQTEDVEGERVGPDVKQGEEFDVDFIYEHGGEWWFYTPFGTRIREQDVERIRDNKGSEEA